MKVIETEIEGVFMLEPWVFGDDRGYFFESFSLKHFEEKVSKTVFVQDNESKSKYGVLRGLHYQLPPYTQAKLVRVFWMLPWIFVKVHRLSGSMLPWS